MTADSEDTLQEALEQLVPGAFLRWQEVPSLGIEGYLLDFDSASRPLDAETADRVMNEPPFWGLLWPAGHLLSRIVTNSPHLVANRTCVDLGCGSGLFSAILARAGARTVAADSDPLSCRVTRLHLERHRLKATVTPCWEDEAQILFLADFLYDESNLETLDSFRADEIVVVDSRLEELSHPGFCYLGKSADTAFPDLDPHREFGNVRGWYRGRRLEDWLRVFRENTNFDYAQSGQTSSK